MPAEKLKQFLDQENVKYVIIRHSPAYTASEIAQSAHIPGRELAKTVMVKIDGKMAMAVLPSSKRVHPEELGKALGADQIEIAEENEFTRLFPGCEAGAMPPFGNLYDMDVYVDPLLSEDEEIAFNAGSHSELVQLRYADYERLVNPRKISFTL